MACACPTRFYIQSSTIPNWLCQCLLNQAFVVQEALNKTLHTETFKGIVHRKIKFLSLFVHTHIVVNLYDFVSKDEILKNIGTQCFGYYCLPLCGLKKKIGCTLFYCMCTFKMLTVLTHNSIE